MRASSRLCDPVVQIPHFQPTCVVPFDPMPVDGVVPIFNSREGTARCGPEFASAVIAVADASAGKAAPTVIGEAVRMTALDDLGQDARKILVVVGAVDTGNVFISRTV